MLEYPFATPIYWNPDGITVGNDQCPAPIERRRIGAQTSTGESAAQIASRSDTLSFLPELMARPWISQRRLKIVRVREWPEVQAMLYLSARADLVPQKLFTRLASEARKGLAQRETP